MDRQLLRSISRNEYLLIINNVLPSRAERWRTESLNVWADNIASEEHREKT